MTVVGYETIGHRHSEQVLARLRGGRGPLTGSPSSGRVAGMRAWRVHELGNPDDVLTFEEVEKPAPGPGQVLVKVRAAALNFFDALMIQGVYQEKPPLPFIPGSEICGEIVETGQRVIGSVAGGPGGYAEYALMDADAAWPVPEGMSDEKAAALYITYQTGHVGLHRRANLQAGEWLLVHAGAGGVGSAAIQLGKAAGAKVIATAGGEHKVQVCRDLGADHAIDYTAEDFVPLVKEITGGHGADVIYDPVGGDVFDKSRKCIAFEGRLVVVGFTSGRIPEAPANHLLVKNYSVVGLHWGAYRHHDAALFGQVHEDLTRLVEQGAIDPLVSRTLPLDQAKEALRALTDRGHRRQDRAGALTDATGGMRLRRADCSRCARAVLRRAGVRRLGRLRDRQAGRGAVPQPARGLPLRHPRRAPAARLPRVRGLRLLRRRPAAHPGDLRRARRGARTRRWLPRSSPSSRFCGSCTRCCGTSPRRSRCRRAFAAEAREAVGRVERLTAATPEELAGSTSVRCAPRWGSCWGGSARPSGGRVRRTGAVRTSWGGTCAGRGSATRACGAPT